MGGRGAKKAGFIYRLDEDYTPPVINYKNVNGSFMISQQYTQTPPVINYKNVNGSFMISQQYTQIPLSWLDREDFEVLD